ncbi:MAG: hypothetical protein ACRDWD_17030 [Acidimicrobiia bacterium]
MKEKLPMRHVHRPLLAVVIALGLFAAACDDDGGGSSSTTDSDDSTETSNGGDLVGLFAVDAGQCADAGVTKGSYFRMVQPGGDPESGPFVDNVDAGCGDASYTPLSPGTDGGLITGEYQPQPDPPFTGDNQGGATETITEPQAFFAIDFAVSTNEVDPQDGTDVPAPSVSAAADGSLSGDLRAWGVAYSGQFFNQGSPKPDGSQPGNTSGPTGTYNSSTGKYVLEWTSLIVGGPFDGFTGVWHLDGTFEEQT